MFSRVVDAEQKLKAEHPSTSIHKGFKIFSIEPGVVDTEMQNEIRSASKDNFSRIEHFISYKLNDQLSNPANVSKKYFEILDNIGELKEVLLSIRDFE